MHDIDLNQLYPVTSCFGTHAYFSLERAAAPYFGIKVNRLSALEKNDTCLCSWHDQLVIYQIAHFIAPIIFKIVLSVIILG